MKTEYKLVLTEALPIQDVGASFRQQVTPISQLLTSLQLHIAQKISQQIKFISPDYEFLVHMGRIDEALLQARLSNSPIDLETIYTILRDKGIQRPDLLDEMVTLVATRKKLRGQGKYVIPHLIDTERYQEALDILSSIKVDYWNHVGILLSRGNALGKLGRSAEARATFEETERVIRQYHLEGELVPPFMGLAQVLTQQGEREWANRLLDEVCGAIQTIDNPAIFRSLSLWYTINDLVELGRQQEAYEFLAQAEQLAAKAKGEHRINALCDLMECYVKLGQREKAEQHLPEVEQAALRLKDAAGKHYHSVLEHVGLVLLDLGLPERALVFAQLMKEDYGYESDYVDMIKKLVDNNEFDKSNDILAGLTDPQARENAQNIIALGLAKAGRLAEAEAMYKQRILPPARHWTGADDYPNTLVFLILALASIGQHDKVRTLFPRVLEVVEQIISLRRDWLLRDLAIGLAKHNLPDLAFQIVQKYYFGEPPIDGHREIEIDKVAQTLAEYGHFEEALEIIRGMGFWLDSTNSYVQEEKARHLLKTAVFLTKQSRTEQANQIFEEGRSLLESVSSDTTWSFNCLAWTALQMNKVDVARHMLEKVSSRTPVASVTTLVGAAYYWTTLNEVEEANQLFEAAYQKAVQIDDADTRADDLLYLLRWLLAAKRVEQARGILQPLEQAIKSIGGQYSRFRRAKRRQELIILLIEAGEVEASRLLLARMTRSLHRNSKAYRGSEKLREVILALGQAGRWDEALALATIDRHTWIDWDKGEQFSKFLKSLRMAGMQSEAKRIVKHVWENIQEQPLYTSSQDDTWWSLSGDAIGRGVARSGLVAETLEIIHAREVHTDKIAFDLANTLAEQGRFPEAIALLNYVDVDEYIEAICRWAPGLEKVENGLSLSMIREVIRIVGWVRTDWYEIYELLVD